MQDKQDIARARKYGFRGKAGMTSQQAHDHEQLLARLSAMQIEIGATWSTDAQLTRRMMEDPYMRPAAIAIRRTPHTLIATFTQQDKKGGLLSRILRHTSLSYHEKNNTETFRRIRALATLTTHNRRRTVSAIKNLSTEQFNALLKSPPPGRRP